LFYAAPFYASAASAQTPTRSADKRDLTGYWRDVSTAQSTAELVNLARPPIPEPPLDSTLLTSIRRIRQYELTLDKTDAYLAVRDLLKLVEKAPDNAWAHFALGAMLARGPDIRSRDFAESNAYQPQTYSLAAERAPKELMRALELDPYMDAAAMELGNLALDLGKPELIRNAIDQLTANGRSNNPRSLLLASKLENKLLSPKRAANMAYEARVAGADASLAAYQRALSLFRVEEFKGSNDSIAAKIYYSGIDSLTADGADVYYNSIAILVNDRERKAWEAADLEGRKQWLRHFWDMHAGLAGVSPARRVIEHFARVEHAELIEHPPMFVNEKAPVPKRRGFFSWLLGGKPTVGEIHYGVMSTIRHGDPNQAQKFLVCPAGWDTLPVPLQPKLETCMGTDYGKKQYAKRNSATVQDAIDKALRGESYYPRYNYHIQTAWEFMQFRAAKGGSEIVATAAVAGDGADKLLSLAGELAPVVTVSLVDTINDWVRVARSSERVSSKAFTADWLMLFNAGVTAPPGKNVALRVAVENATWTAGRIDYGTVDIDAFDPAQLTMSDIVMSPYGGPGGFKRGDVSLTLAPGRTFTPDDVATLYYEVYGATKDQPLVTEVRIEPVRQSTLDQLRAKLGRSDGAVSAQFTERAGASIPQFGLQQTRDVGFKMLVPGEYRIRITVTESATGRSASRVRKLVIKG
jgi:hypothetical protein